MQISVVDLKQMTDPVFQEGYRMWRSNPFTERMIAILQRAVDNNRIGAPCRSEDALIYAGLTDGERELMSWLTDMVGRASAAQVAVSTVAQRLEATYGVRQPEKRG